MENQMLTPLTNEELDAAIEAGTARVVFSKLGFRIVVHGELKYSCTSSIVSLWTSAAGTHRSDFRGNKLVWSIKKVEPETGYARKQPRKAMELDQLVQKLRQATSFAEQNNGRWSKIDWPLLTPENMKVLLAEVERAQTAQKAA